MATRSAFLVLLLLTPVAALRAGIWEVSDKPKKNQEKEKSLKDLQEQLQEQLQQQKETPEDDFEQMATDNENLATTLRAIQQVLHDQKKQRKAAAKAAGTNFAKMTNNMAELIKKMDPLSKATEDQLASQQGAISKGVPEGASETDFKRAARAFEDVHQTLKDINETLQDQSHEQAEYENKALNDMAAAVGPEKMNDVAENLVKAR